MLCERELADLRTAKGCFPSFLDTEGQQSRWLCKREQTFESSYSDGHRVAN